MTENKIKIEELKENIQEQPIEPAFSVEKKDIEQHDNVEKLDEEKNNTFYIGKIVENLVEKLSDLESINNKSITIQKEFVNIFEQKKKNNHKSVIRKHILRNKDYDIYDLGVHLRSIGIVKFFDILNAELHKQEVKKSYLQSTNQNELDKEIELLNDRCEKERKYFDKVNELYFSYPENIRRIFVSLFKKDNFKLEGRSAYFLHLEKILKTLHSLFKANEIKSQQEIIELKNSDDKLLFFKIKKKYQISKINKYYRIYEDYKLYTDGTDLFKEYLAHKDANKDLEATSDRIQKIKSTLYSLEHEKELYEKENKEYLMETENEEVFKRKIIDLFLSYADKEDMLVHYLEKFEKEKQNDTSLLKERVVNDILAAFYFKTQEKIKESNEKISEFNQFLLTDIIKPLKKYKFESIEEDLFTNIDYFKDVINSRIQEQVLIRRFFTQTNNPLRSESYDVFIDDLEAFLNSNGIDKPVYIKNDEKEVFSKTEIQKIKDDYKKIKKLCK